MIADGLDVYIVDGTVMDWLRDETVLSLPFDGLTPQEADAICRLALVRGYSVALQRKKRWIKGGDDDGTAEGGEVL